MWGACWVYKVIVLFDNKTMKLIILESKSSVSDLDKYGKDLMNKLRETGSMILCDEVKADFSNIKDLFDEEEKILLFNPFSINGKFNTLTDNLPKFKNVKYILSPYSFYDGLDISLLQQLGIRYRNNAGANAKSVAQHALTLSLMLLGRFPLLATKNVWPDGSILGEEIAGKTAVIVGMGKVGLSLYPLLAGLGVTTKYYNRNDKKLDIPKITFEEIFENDLIFLTIASNLETREIVEPLPSLLKPQNYLIDISATDDLYDKKAVLKQLERGEFSGFGVELDKPDFLMPVTDCNFISTPHMAWATKDAERRTVRDYLNRALMVIDGRADEVDFVV